MHICNLTTSKHKNETGNKMAIESYEIWSACTPSKLVGVRSDRNQAYEFARSLAKQFGDCVVNFKITCEATGLSLLPEDVRERNATK